MSVVVLVSKKISKLKIRGSFGFDKSRHLNLILSSLTEVFEGRGETEAVNDPPRGLDRRRQGFPVQGANRGGCKTKAGIVDQIRLPTEHPQVRHRPVQHLDGGAARQEEKKQDLSQSLGQ
jgi:hypothetical protein